MQAESVHFIAKYCPLLISLHINPYLGWKTTTAREVKVRDVEPLILALKTLVQHCKNMEVLGVIRATNVIHARRRGIETWQIIMRLEEDVELDVAETPICSREDAVEEWCRTTLWNCIEYSQLNRYEYNL
jgi:hypothetical protein